MNDGKNIIEELFQPLIGMEARVLLGHGSFLTMDFGKDIVKEINTRRGTRTISCGEWRFWVYMCAWRIDCLDRVFVGSEDNRELIAQKLSEWKNKKLQSFSVLNLAFDSVLTFDKGYTLRLFSHNIKENEQWIFYTPNQYAFVAGPGESWSYERSDIAMS